MRGVIFIVVFAAAATAIAAEPQCMAVVPRGTAQMDGRAGAGEWNRAAAFPLASVVAGAGRMDPAHPAVARVMWDDAALYVLVEAPLPGGRGIFAQARDHDGAVWMDDAVEVFVQPGGASAYWQFMVNGAGSKYEGQARDASWNGEWRAAVTTEGGVMRAEVAVPWATFGATPKEGDSWRANFAADIGGQALVATWAPCEGTLHQPERFGTIVLGDAAGGVQITRLGPIGRRHLGIGVHATGPCSVEAAVKVGGKAVAGSPWRKAVGPGAGELEATWADEGPGELVVTVTGPKGEPLLRTVASFASLADFKLQPASLLDIGKLRVKLALNVPQTEDARAEVSLRRANGAVVETRELVLPAASGTAATDFPIAGLGRERCTISATARRPDGTVIAKAQAAWQAPWWWGSKAGAFDDNWVPAPFTPVQVAGKVVSVWGRTMDFSKGPLPVQITSLGKPLLAAPVAIEAETDAGPVKWRASEARIRRAGQGVVEVSGDLSAPGLTVRIANKIEFDGLMWMSVQVVPQGTTTVRRMHFVMPLRAETASLMDYSPKLSGVDWGGGKYELNFHAVPDKPWRSGFRQWMWIGDHERGIEWLCGHPVNWRPHDGDAQVEVEPAAATGGPVVFRARFLDEPTRIDKPTDFEFLLQASPVKPKPTNWRRIRYRHAGYYGLESQPAMMPVGINYPAPGNIRLDRGTLELWVTPAFDSEEPHPCNRSLFSLRFPDTGTEFTLYWNLEDRGPRVVYYEAGKYLVVSGVHVVSKAGQPIRYAMTWGERTRVYADGKLVLDIPYKGSINASLDGAHMVLGGGTIYLLPGFSVRAIKVSDVELPAEALGAEPKPKEHTLLLDDLQHIVTRDGATYSEARVARGERLALVTGPAGAVKPASGAPAQLFKMGVALDVLAADKCQFIGFHEHWTPYQGAPYTTETEALHGLVRGCHERGLGLLLYHSGQIADIAPEWGEFSDAWIIEPREKNWLYSRAPKQTDWCTCRASASWRDFECANIEREVRDFGIDGIYSDGLLWAVDCTNVNHGCPASGESVHWRGLDAGRVLAKRLWRIVKSQPKPTFIVMHCEGALLPIYSFADAFLDGERFNTIPKSMNFKFPLDSFAAGFMGHAWGPIPYYLVYHGQCWTEEQGLAFTLIHDVTLPWSAGTVDVVQDAFNDFGVDDAEWVPYWRIERVARVETAGVKVSAYVKKKGGPVLLVVSNLNTQAATARVALDLRALGWKPGAALKAWEYRSRREAPVEGGVLSLDMQPETAAIVRIGAAKGANR